MYDATLYRLKVFTLVVEQRSVGAAAAALGLSQPSVSTHVKGLENLLGQPLFDRRPGKPMELTERCSSSISAGHRRCWSAC